MIKQQQQHAIKLKQYQQQYGNSYQQLEMEATLRLISNKVSRLLEQS